MIRREHQTILCPLVFFYNGQASLSLKRRKEK
jgi:hypothetical protein